MGALMATGYTHDVAEGKVTEFDEFALRCARGMGALILMRDSAKDAPIPKFEPSEYTEKRLAEAQANLATVEAWSLDEAEAAQAGERAEKIKARDRYESERNAHADRYRAMIAKVEAWTPPTPDHQGLKDFMLSQLAESLEFDCSPLGDYFDPAPELDAEQYRLRQIVKAAKALASAATAWDEEVQRTEDRNRWVRQLRESLAVMDGSYSK